MSRNPFVLVRKQNTDNRNTPTSARRAQDLEQNDLKPFSKRPSFGAKWPISSNDPQNGGDRSRREEMSKSERDLANPLPRKIQKTSTDTAHPTDITFRASKAFTRAQTTPRSAPAPKGTAGQFRFQNAPQSRSPTRYQPGFAAVQTDYGRVVAPRSSTSVDKSHSFDRDDSSPEDQNNQRDVHSRYTVQDQEHDPNVYPEYFSDVPGKSRVNDSIDNKPDTIPGPCEACAKTTQELQISLQTQAHLRKKLKEEKVARLDSQGKLALAQQEIENLKDDLKESKIALERKEARLAMIVRCVEEESREVALQAKEAVNEPLVACSEAEESLSVD